MGRSQAWIPRPRSRSPAPAEAPLQASQVQALPCPPTCSPSSQVQDHTHWFSSRSRVKLVLKAGMTKLTWARWTGWGWGKSRGGVNLGKPVGGNLGILEAPEEGVALGRGGAQPSSCADHRFGGRCFA